MNKFTQYKQLIILLLFFQYSAVGQEYTSSNNAVNFLGIPFGKTYTEVRSIMQSKNYVEAGYIHDSLYISNVSYGQQKPSFTYLRFNSKAVFIEGVMVFRNFKDFIGLESLITAKYGEPTKKEYFLGTNILWYNDHFSIVLKISNGVCTIKYQDNKLCDIDANDKLNKKLNDNI
jgi:hypothetical protein